MNVKVARLKTKSGKSRPRSVGKAVARDSSGRLMDIFTLDANSPTFDDDLTFVYRSNVAKARRENVKLFGSPDGVSGAKSGRYLNVGRKKK